MEAGNAGANNTYVCWRRTGVLKWYHCQREQGFLPLLFERSLFSDARWWSSPKSLGSRGLRGCFLPPRDIGQGASLLGINLRQGHNRREGLAPHRGTVVHAAWRILLVIAGLSSPKSIRPPQGSVPQLNFGGPHKVPFDDLLGLARVANIGTLINDWSRAAATQ